MHQGKITEVFRGGIKNFPLFSHQMILRYVWLNDVSSKYKHKWTNVEVKKEKNPEINPRPTGIFFLGEKKDLFT